jgi:nitroreductase
VRDLWTTALQAVLATEKESAPRVYQLLAVQLRGQGMDFGWISGYEDKKVLEALNVPPVRPYLAVVYIDSEAQADASGRMSLSVEPYKMPFKFAYIRNFLSVMASRLKR